MLQRAGIEVSAHHGDDEAKTIPGLLDRGKSLALNLELRVLQRL
jgi:hypothetical protein